MDSSDNIRGNCRKDLRTGCKDSQAAEIIDITDQNLTRERYFRSVRGKTGGFFSLPIFEPHCSPDLTSKKLRRSDLAL